MRSAGKRLQMWEIPNCINPKSLRNWEVIWESARKMVCIVPIKSDTPSLVMQNFFINLPEINNLKRKSLCVIVDV